MSHAQNYKEQFQTTPEFSRYMASLVPASARTVLEPTPGIGYLKQALLDRGLNVTAPVDYFLHPKGRYDCIVMNPPFSHKFTILDNAPQHLHKAGMAMGYYFLEDCLQQSDHVIALMPWFTISDSDVRLRAIKSYGMKAITALPRRAFNYARVQTVVLELVKGWSAPTEFIVYDLLNPYKQIPLFV